MEKNVERDQRNYKALREMGIKVIVIWGCQIKEMRKDPDYENEVVNKIIDKIFE